MNAGNWVHLDVEKVLRVTDKAMLLRLESGEEVWIPISQMADPDDYDKGDENCTISVSRWIAEQKDLI